MTTLDQYREGVEASTDVLNKVFRIGLSKALDPLNRRDFLVITGRVAKHLRAAGGIPEEKALREAIDILDVDWARLTPAGTDKVIEAARRAQLDAMPIVKARVTEVFNDDGALVHGAARRSAVGKYNLDIEANFTANDDRIMRFNTKSQANFVTNSVGVRANATSAQARNIISDGLRRGLSRKDLSKNLEAGLYRSGINRTRSYYEVVAGSFTNRSRTYSQLSAFTDADIAKFTFEAMLDEATSNVCRFMHGKTFEVKRALQTIEQTEAETANPERIKDIQPWVRDAEGERGPEVQANVAGEAITVARVMESAVGQKDKIGRFSEGMSVAELEATGVTLPPLHGFCRSTVVPDF